MTSAALRGNDVTDEQVFSIPERAKEFQPTLTDLVIL